MDLSELNTAAVNDQLVSGTLSFEWSEDNKISLIAEKCVHIFKLKPFLTSTCYLASNLIGLEQIALPPVIKYPTVDVGINIDDKLNEFSKTEYFELILDPLLCPDTNKLNSQPTVVKTILAKWSPAGFVKYNRCLLATLTNTGSVDIFVNHNIEMNNVCNLSEKWLVILREQWKSSGASLSFDLLKQRVNEACITYVTWSCLYSNDVPAYGYLVTGQRNGGICIWRINFIESNLPHNLTTSLEVTFVTCGGSVCNLHWIDNGQDPLLIVGYSNGRVKCFSLSMENNKISRKRETTLWPENDDMRTVQIKSTHWEDSFLIILIKGSHIIVITVDHSGQLLNTAVHDVENLFITGFVEIGNNEYVVGTYTGHFCTIKLLKGLSDNDIVIEESVMSCNVDFSNYALHGFVCSKNRVMWALALSPSRCYDHLIMRQPANITFCYSQRFDAMKILKANSSQKLTHYWDCMEVTRCISTMQNVNPAESTLGPQDYAAMSTYDLKILLWEFTVIEELIKKQNTRRTIEVKSQITILVPLIHTRHVCERITTVCNQIQSTKSVNEFQKLSLHCLTASLLELKSQDQYTLYGESFNKQVNEAIEMGLNCTTNDAHEKCTWCLADIKLLTCPNDPKHLQTRCSVSLVQTSNETFLTCALCGRVGHIALSDEKVTCPWCDGRLINENSLQSVTIKTPANEDDSCVEIKQEDETCICYK